MASAEASYQLFHDNVEALLHGVTNSLDHNVFGLGLSLSSTLDGLESPVAFLVELLQLTPLDRRHGQRQYFDDIKKATSEASVLEVFGHGVVEAPHL
jgi:hypothetical protein